MGSLAFVLMVLLNGDKPAYPLVMQEFSSKDACEAAKTSIETKIRDQHLGNPGLIITSMWCQKK